MKTIFLLSMLLIFPQEPELSPDIAKWENDVQQLEQRDQTQDIVENGIVFYGSSSIRLWNTIAQDMAPWPTIQRGYGGAKLPDIIHYAPRILGAHLGESNPKRCRAVVLFVANDIVGNENDGSPEEVANRFLKLHRWIRQQDTTIPVFWIEVTPTHSRWNAWPKIEEATKRIEKIIDADPQTHLISTAGAYLGIDGLPRAELFVDDQLHLHPDGYKQWAILIKANLHQRLGAAEPRKVLPETK